MRRGKRLFSLLLVLAMVFSALPVIPTSPAVYALNGEAAYKPAESCISGKYWVSASADINTAAAKNAIDGDPETAWNYGDVFPATLTVDLGGAYDAVRKTQIVFTDPLAYYQYKLEGSKDGDVWVSLADRTANTAVAIAFTDVFSFEGLRYIRLTVTGCGMPAGGVSEFLIFNYLRDDMNNGSDTSGFTTNTTYYNAGNNPPAPDGIRGGGVMNEESMNTGDNFFGLTKDLGWDTIRLRIWNDPKSESDNTWWQDRPHDIVDFFPAVNTSGGNCSVENTKTVAKYISGAGQNLAIDFHYADSWSDPQNQPKPYAWANLPWDDPEPGAPVTVPNHAIAPDKYDPENPEHQVTVEKGLVTTVHDFTYDTINQLVEQGTAPTVVALGNEITNGMLWGSEYELTNPYAHFHDYFARFIRGRGEGELDSDLVNADPRGAAPKGGGVKWIVYEEALEKLAEADGDETSEAYAEYLELYGEFEESITNLATLIDAGQRAIDRINAERGTNILTELHFAFNVFEQPTSGKVNMDPEEVFAKVKALVFGLRDNLNGDDMSGMTDRIGVSYYPDWHGTYDIVQRNIVELSKGLPGVKFNIAECSPKAGGSVSNAGSGWMDNPNVVRNPMNDDPSLPDSFTYDMQWQGQDTINIMKTINDVPNNVGMGVWPWNGQSVYFSGGQMNAGFMAFSQAFATGVIESVISVTTTDGIAPVLPGKVAELNVATGEKSDVSVTWDEIPEESYTAPGTFTVKGVADAAGNMTEATAVVTVVAGDGLYTVKYSGNGAVSGAPMRLAVYAGEKFLVANGESFTHPMGYAFKEWNTKNNGLGTSYLPGAEVTMQEGDITLYAIWDYGDTGATFYNDPASLPGDVSDPHILYDDKSGYYYAYSTGGAKSGYRFGIYKSADMVTWERLSGAIPSDDPNTWAQTWFWAPECYYNENNGYYYLFYSGRMTNAEQAAAHFGFEDFEEACKTGVAVSKSPEGPFMNITNAPIDYYPYDPDYRDVNAGKPTPYVERPTQEQVNASPLGVYIPFIDANVLFDDDGRVYLYYSRNAYRNWVYDSEIGRYIEESNIYVVELNSDWWTTAGEPVMPTVKAEYINENKAEGDADTVRKDGFVPVINYALKPQSWENAHVDDYAEYEGARKDRRWAEGSFIMKYDFDKDNDGAEETLYYIIYSCNNFENQFYGEGYAVSESPLGPFEKSSANPFMSQDEEIPVYSTGHGSYIATPDGKELFHMYHGRAATSGANSGRRGYINRIFFDETMLTDGVPTLSVIQAKGDQPMPSGVGPFSLSIAEDTVNGQNSLGITWDVKNAAGGAFALGSSLNKTRAFVNDESVAEVSVNETGDTAFAAGTLSFKKSGSVDVTVVYQRQKADGTYEDVYNIVNGNKTPVSATRTFTFKMTEVPGGGGGGGTTSPAATPTPAPSTTPVSSATPAPTSETGVEEPAAVSALATIAAADGGEAVEGADGSTTLTAGGTLTMDNGAEIAVPAGSIVSADGLTVSIPRGGASAEIRLDEEALTVEPGMTIELVDSGVALGGVNIYWDNPFGDVADDAWFLGDVSYAYRNMLMEGTSAEPMMFSPAETTTRGMIVTVLYRMEGSPDVDGLESTFADVEAGQWYADAVKWAASEGIVLGYKENEFAPNDPVTREQLVTILKRFMDYKEMVFAVTQQFIMYADAADISDYAMDAIQTMNKLGVINGVGENTIAPKANATRAEFAAMLKRFNALETEN